ncbi:hypothetical protein PABG_02062 [Paracoccidioides brasiliensis Pb03]|uniref:Protein YOP1 n=1 Tax=Paracoccidioides brasiliensis (strain Pb18) TaxID=502780 RepID=C1G0S1_PARBD|nr:uncharacterized protein PADG_00461 [Paracoccidioides brasiliensis Pb18]EEH19803.2 hypothetical protein PABG_02062 [Paracoccidioides brasiliensis Pb03]EEH44172.1 hypothetical protein PADG_00461 [Paracoccidioides brasiliensis Pb18]
MFGVIADLLSSVLTILFPIFASYKALRASDPTQLAPWLMYWVVMSLILLAESWTYFIVGWFPFYSWIRLFALSYLVLPQTQGAKLLYQRYVDPFLFHHEREIEQFISQAHRSAKAVGLEYFYKAVDLVRDKVLGLPPIAPVAPPTPPQSAGAGAFAQSLLSRFSIPAASSLANPASDLFSLLAAAMAPGPASGSREVQAEELSASGKLMPDNIASASKAEQAEYILRQKERLGMLMSAFDREQRNLRMDAPGNDDLAYGTAFDEYEEGGLRKNRSDVSFENIDRDELFFAGDNREDHHSHGQHQRRGGRTSGGGDVRDFSQSSVGEIATASGVYR